jgi:hypothetical protein
MSSKNNAARFRKFADAPHHTLESKPIDIEQEVARKQQLENENTAQDIRLKRVTIDRLFRFLAAETALIFVFTFFQAINWPAQFQLEDWSFRLVVSATIAQITGMLFVAVRYLFPNNK